MKTIVTGQMGGGSRDDLPPRPNRAVFGEMHIKRLFRPRTLGMQKKKKWRRAEARETVRSEQGAGSAPAIVELARALRVKNPEESMLRLTEVCLEDKGVNPWFC